MIQKITNLSFAKLSLKTITEHAKKKRGYQKMHTTAVKWMKVKVFLSLQILRTPLEMEDKMMKRHSISSILSLYNLVFMIYITVLYLELHKMSRFNHIPHHSVNRNLVIQILKILNTLFANPKYMTVRRRSKLKKE